jgi:pimeloyl-ACP methyl ester carboxylesterase
MAWQTRPGWQAAVKEAADPFGLMVWSPAKMHLFRDPFACITIWRRGKKQPFIHHRGGQVMKHRTMQGICLVTVLLLFLVSGCMFAKLEKEMEDFEETWFIIGGYINNQSPHQKDVVVVAYEDTSGEKVAVKAMILESSGDYAIEVKRGNYFLMAFEDRNSNLEHDPDEYVGWYGKPDRITVNEENMPADTPHGRKDLDFTIAEAKPYPAGFASQLPMSAQVVKGSALVFGELISFADPKMDLEYGRMGYWEPLTFLREVGAGVYFLEPYDPKKIPVLFVHGAVGTPIHFKDIAGHIDRKRYQPWLFYYPSGMPLEKISTTLNIMVMELHQEYRFKKLHVVAHSMGGLVARRFILININDHQQDYIDLFISISTPWGGHRMAEKGVEQAPTAIPSWYDMVPGSPFIDSIFAQRLPDSLPYFLMFSFKGESSHFMGNNDGSVELVSELDYRAQAEANRIFGFNESHVGILSSKRVLENVSRLLEGGKVRRGYKVQYFGISQ